MQSCYHDDARFTDPVFQNLTAMETKAMWHMLTAAAVDLKVLFGNVQAGEHIGTCQWQAWYTFSRTGRKVHNRIDASFGFKDGKIIRHVDQFDLWRWSRMALGLPGVVLGWTPIIPNQIRKTARKGLDKFIEVHPEYKR